MKKSISKLFDNSKLNNMDQIFGGDQTGRANDTVSGSNYDVRTTCPGPNGGNIGDVTPSTSVSDNPGASR